MNRRPLIAHVLYRLDTGGMERVLVTVMNHTRSQYRHAVVCLEDFGPLREQIVDPNVPCLALHKKTGKDLGCYVRLWRALHKLDPDLVATYNVGAIDAAPVARLAGVRHVVHAERGRDASDPRGERRKYQRLRRWMQPFIERYLAVSVDLHDWLTETVGVDPSRVVHIPNGIDATRYRMAGGANAARPLLGSFAPSGTILIGTVGRLDPVKDQAGLVSAFKLLCESMPGMQERLRLVIVGKGPRRAVLGAQITRLGLGGQVLLAGNRDDVPALLAEFDFFVLSSIAEGMPGVVLEAMAAGLPVVATEVGGVGEIVVSGVTGQMVPAGNPRELADAMVPYVSDEVLRTRHGHAGRERVETGFDVHDMVAAYIALYDELLGRQACAESTHAMPSLAAPRER